MRFDYHPERKVRPEIILMTKYSDVYFQDASMLVNKQSKVLISCLQICSEDALMHRLLVRLSDLS